MSHFFKRISLFALILASTLTLTGCFGGPDIEAEVDARKERARTVLSELESDGINEWLPKQYSEIKRTYQEGMRHADNNNLRAADESYTKFNRLVSIARTDLRTAKQQASAQTNNKESELESEIRNLKSTKTNLEREIEQKDRKINDLENKVKKSHDGYIVKKGDTLYSIAKAVYNDGKEWKKIVEDNKEILPNPNWIYPGQVLKVSK